MIVADGVIEPSTPQAFVDFLQVRRRGPQIQAVVFFNSRGGNVVASMEFGAMLRELGMAGIVGGFVSDGIEARIAGECVSACVYALMGAVKRIAPPGSEVALHRMSIVETEARGLVWAAHEAQLRRRADGRCARPLRAPDGGQSGPRARRGIPPARHDAFADAGEMRRWSFAVSQF